MAVTEDYKSKHKGKTGTKNKQKSEEKKKKKRRKKKEDEKQGKSNHEAKKPLPPRNKKDGMDLLARGMGLRSEKASN